MSPTEGDEGVEGREMERILGRASPSAALLSKPAKAVDTASAKGSGSGSLPLAQDVEALPAYSIHSSFPIAVQRNDDAENC